MYNHWKLATIGMALVTTTAFVTGVTTAYLTRPATGAGEPVVVDYTAPASLAVASTSRPVSARRTAPATVARSAVAAPMPNAASGPTVPTATSSPSATTVAADCSTGGDRALRIAKPGALGGLLGAGLGAAGGAIADGGHGAGKGALIGGLTGAALGTGYGAYKTKNECGTVFGNSTARISPISLP